jgi:hypothetical protein
MQPSSARSHPLNYAISSDRAPCEAIRFICLRSSTSHSPLLTNPPVLAFRIRPAGCSTGSFDDAIVMQIDKPRRQKSVLLITSQPRSRHTAHITVSTGPSELTEILLWYVILWSSWAEASHVVVRHFFHWSGSMHGTTKAGQHHRNHRQGIVVKVVMVRQLGERGQRWRSYSYLDQCNWLENDLRRSYSRVSNLEWEIEEFELQTGFAVVLSCGEAEKGGSIEVGLCSQGSVAQNEM